MNKLGLTPMRKAISEGYADEALDLSDEDHRPLRTRRSEPDLFVSIARFDAIVEDPKVSAITIRETYAEMQNSRATEKAKKLQIEFREPTWDIVDTKYAQRMATGTTSLAEDPMIVEEPFVLVEEAPQPSISQQVSTGGIVPESETSGDEDVDPAADDDLKKATEKKKKADDAAKKVFAGVVIESSRKERKKKEGEEKEVEEEGVEEIEDPEDPKGKKKASLVGTVKRRASKE